MQELVSYSFKSEIPQQLQFDYALSRQNGTDQEGCGEV
jgi:hypothetical protein